MFDVGVHIVIEPQTFERSRRGYKS